MLISKHSVTSSSSQKVVFAVTFGADLTLSKIKLIKKVFEENSGVRATK
jgi:hypothetical protein